MTEHREDPRFRFLFGGEGATYYQHLVKPAAAEPEPEPKPEPEPERTMSRVEQEALLASSSDDDSDEEEALRKATRTRLKAQAAINAKELEAVRAAEDAAATDAVAAALDAAPVSIDTDAVADAVAAALDVRTASSSSLDVHAAKDTMGGSGSATAERRLSVDVDVLLTPSQSDPRPTESPIRARGALTGNLPLLAILYGSALSSLTDGAWIDCRPGRPAVAVQLVRNEACRVHLQAAGLARDEAQ